MDRQMVDGPHPLPVPSPLQEQDLPVLHEFLRGRGRSQPPPVIKRARLKGCTATGTVIRCTMLRGIMISFEDRWLSQVTTDLAPRHQQC